MASTPLDLPILVSQLPSMQQIAAAHLVPHEAQQVLFGQMVAEHQRKDEQKVQEVEKKEGLEALGPETGGKNSTPGFARQRRPQPEALPQPDTQSSNASPWAGNIINVKI
ncbi:MAG: hypothetical protein Q7U56_01985 [Humidesulfovibrio sp.]|nr:hypothetical protein [Humidesulfovibrio sp.]